MIETACPCRAALDRHRGLVEVGEGPHERQAEAGALMAPAHRSRYLAEGLERLRDVLRRHADAGVGDDEFEPARGVIGDRGRDRAAFGRELDGVGDEIEQDLADRAVVADERRLGRAHVERHREGSAFGALAHEMQQLVGERPQIELLLDDLDVAGLDLRQVEEVADDVQEMLAAGVDVARIFGIARRDGAEQARHDRLGIADDGVERRPELVAHVGEEIRLGPARRLGRFLRGDGVLLGLAQLGHVGEGGDDAAVGRGVAADFDDAALGRRICWRNGTPWRNCSIRSAT